MKNLITALAISMCLAAPVQAQCHCSDAPEAKVSAPVHVGMVHKVAFKAVHWLVVKPLYLIGTAAVLAVSIPAGAVLYGAAALDNALAY